MSTTKAELKDRLTAANEQRAFCERRIVALQAQARELAEALEPIVKGYSLNQPWEWHKRAARALAAYRASQEGER